MHGRTENLAAAVEKNEKTFTIAGSGSAVNELLQCLCRCGLGYVHVSVGCELSYENETIVTATAEELLTEKFPALCSLVIVNDKASDAVVTHGIPDSEFVRGDVPMTKEEVRSVSLSKLRLTKSAVVYDIGAGTGSVSVEMARIANNGKVYAIERKEEACSLIEKNCRKLACTNVEIIKSYAPEGLDGLPAPTHVFIGGSGGNMKEIVQRVFDKNPMARVVINTIAMESTAEALDIINTLPVQDAEIVSLNVARSRKIAKYNMMTGNNPVFVFSFTGRGEK
jgi:precorrin-6Y C5,15-methyltransferase (decarboxylating)